MDEIIRVAILGATGKMGTELLKALSKETDIEPVAGIARREGFLYVNGKKLPLFSDIEKALVETRPEVLIDFSFVEATRKAIEPALKRKVNLVIGTSGLTSQDLAQIEKLAKENEVGAIVAPNFSLGAAVLMALCQIAAKYFDYAEILERHHEQKLDAPSGTALATARAMSASRGKPFLRAQVKKENLPYVRGGEIDGIAIHSLRLPGSLAHQEVIFGAPGETLTIRHDTLSRECYLPGILLAIREVGKVKGLVYGLDKLLKL